MEKKLKLKISVDSKTGAIKVLSGDIDNLNKKTKETKSNFDSVKTSLLAVGGAVAGVYAVSKAVDVLINTSREFINTAMKFEQFSSVLTTLEGSANKAKDSLGWITQFSATTPYQLAAVTEGFVQLKSYGIDPVNGTLRSLGDASSAMGKPLIQAVEAMADAVVGENERLKEFGIRASIMGDQVKYNWTSASGEARQIIVANNSAVIQSTLNSIFNSKYAGAMEAQSKTLQGMLSNISDSYTIFQKNVMDAGVYEYLKALTSIVGTELKKGFGLAEEGSEDFAKGAIEVIKSVISGAGYLFDVVETFIDELKLIKNVGEVGLYGLLELIFSFSSSATSAFESTFNFIAEGFEDLVNGAIEKINSLIEGINAMSFGYLNIPTISAKVSIDSIDLSSTKKTLDDLKVKAETEYETNKKETKKAWEDLKVANTGQNFVADLLSKVDVAYQQILENSDSNTIDKEDFGESVSTTTLPTVDTETETLALEPYKVELESVNTTIEDTTEALQDLNSTLYSDSSNEDDTYTVVSNTIDSFNTLNEAGSNATNIINDTAVAVTALGEDLKNSFLNNLDSSINSLSGVIGIYDSVYNSIYGSDVTASSYSAALEQARTAQSNLEGDMFDTEYALAYTESINNLSRQVSGYLNTDNFATSADYEFAKAVVANTFKDFESTADITLRILGDIRDSAGNMDLNIGILGSTGIEATLLMSDGVVQALETDSFSIALGQDASEVLNAIGTSMDNWDWNSAALEDILETQSLAIDWSTGLTEDVIGYLGSEFDWNSPTAASDLAGYLSSSYGWRDDLSTEVADYLTSSSFDWNSPTAASDLAGYLTDSGYDWSTDLSTSIMGYLGSSFDWNSPTATSDLAGYLSSSFDWMTPESSTTLAGYLSSSSFDWNSPSATSTLAGYLSGASFDWDADGVPDILSNVKSDGTISVTYDFNDDNLPDLTLDFDENSNIVGIKNAITGAFGATGESNLAVTDSGVAGAVNGASIKGTLATSLDDLQVKSVNQYYYTSKNTGGDKDVYGKYYTTAQYMEGQRTTYSYSQGGYTGAGIGSPTIPAIKLPAWCMRGNT